MEVTLDKHQYTIVESLPNCDICAIGTQPFRPLAEQPQINVATYDAATNIFDRYESHGVAHDGGSSNLVARGKWAYMCEGHYEDYGVGLGLGVGQKLILRDSDEHKAIQAEKAKQPKPDVESLLRDAVMGDTVETSDGCIVEPDGECPHGLLSPLRELGLI